MTLPRARRAWPAAVRRQSERLAGCAGLNHQGKTARLNHSQRYGGSRPSRSPRWRRQQSALRVEVRNSNTARAKGSFRALLRRLLPRSAVSQRQAEKATSTPVVPCGHHPAAPARILLGGAASGLGPVRGGGGRCLYSCEGAFFGSPRPCAAGRAQPCGPGTRSACCASSRCASRPCGLDRSRPSG